MNEPMSLRGEGVNASSKKREEGGLWDTAKVILQAVVIALIIRTVLFQPFNIPSGSLIPTLDVGDYLFVSKYSYGYSRYSLPSFLDWLPSDMHGRLFASPPNRGDVAVFKWPVDNSTDYIKRVIGLPGDKIQMIDGDLYINGEKVKRELIGKSDEPIGDNFKRQVKIYNETLPGGVTHEIQTLDDGRGELDNTAVFQVPEGEYFMMGDNRDNSSDSRVWGPAPFENLVGRAQIIFFSMKTAPGQAEETEPAWEFWRWPWTVRWSRLFQPVR
jgi:signal peptidase I